MLHPWIKHRLSEVRTREEAMKVWSEHQDCLAGYTFVISEAQGSGTLRFPAKLDFARGGHLRSVFKYDNLFLINHEVVDHYFEYGKADIPVDYSIAFDANVASYLRAWHRGRTGPVVEMLQAVLHALHTGKFNWDLVPFLLERAQDILDGRDLDRIYETELASAWFAASDRSSFEQTGIIRLTISDDELARRAQASLAEWDRLIRNGFIDTIRERFDPFYACMLKMVLLELENPGPNAGATKLERLLEFMNQELNAMFLLIARAGLEFFQKGGAFKPMAKVATRSPRLLQNIRNVTWDFLQLIWLHTSTGFRGRQNGFMVPYFLTFDKGLAALYDLYPQRSCIFGNEITFPQFYADMDLHALILNPYPELDPVIKRVFNVQAAEERDRRRLKQPFSASTVLAVLETRLREFVTG